MSEMNCALDDNSYILSGFYFAINNIVRLTKINFFNRVKNFNRAAAPKIHTDLRYSTGGIIIISNYACFYIG